MMRLKYKDMVRVVKHYHVHYEFTDLVGEQTEAAFVRYLQDRLGAGWQVIRSTKGSVADVYYKVDVMAIRVRDGEMIDCFLAQVKSSKAAAESVVAKLVDVEGYPCRVPLRVFYPDPQGQGFREVCHG